MNSIENWYVMVLEVMQRENVQTFSYFKTRLFLDRSTVQPIKKISEHFQAITVYLLMGHLV